MDFVREVALPDLAGFGKEHSAAYAAGAPFPHVHFDHFFVPEVLSDVLREFPNLRQQPGHAFDTPNERKRTSRGEHRFGPATRRFLHFLNSQPFLEFLSELTGIPALLPDPFFEGGGCHEILPGGYLKVHADFNKHKLTRLDRRLNVLIYLNHDWREEYGGHFELWDRAMTRCEKKLLPVFNRMAIFTTTDFSYHGHPEPLTCPQDRSRRARALDYYTNGRPAHEINGLGRHPTLFKARPEGDAAALAFSARQRRKERVLGFLADLVPPAIARAVSKKPPR
jgi:hypothetical protein